MSRLRANQGVSRTLAWIPWVVISVAGVGGVWLRCSRLGTASLWFDEGYTAWAVAHPVGEIVRIIRSDTAPPLYYILLRGWTHLFGFSETALRSMSAVMATVTLIFFALIARRLLTSIWAVCAAIVLFSFSFMQIAYAHECRFYSMMTLMESIDLYLVLLVCDRSTPLRRISLILAWTASLYTNNMMVLYLGCLGLAWFLLPGRRSVAHRLKDAPIVSVSTAILFLPWVPSLLAQTRRIQGSFWPEVPHGSDLVRTICVMAGVHQQSLPMGSEQNFLLVIVMLIILSVAACNLLTSTRLVLALVTAGLMPMIITYVYSHVRQSIYMDRSFLASGLMMPLLIVLGLDAVRGPVIKVLSIAGVVLFIWLSLASLPHRQLGEHPEDWRAASAFALSSGAKHRLVVCAANDGEPLFRYYGCDRDYGPRADVTGVPDSFFAIYPPQTMQRVAGDQDLDGLRAKLKAYHPDEVVLMSAHEWWGDHDLRTLKFLSATMKRISEKTVAGPLNVYRFVPGK